MLEIVKIILRLGLLGLGWGFYGTFWGMCGGRERIFLAGWLIAGLKPFFLGGVVVAGLRSKERS